MFFMGSFFVRTFDLEQNEKIHTGTFVKKNIVPKFLELYFFFLELYFFFELHFFLEFYLFFWIFFFWWNFIFRFFF